MPHRTPLWQEAIVALKTKDIFTVGRRKTAVAKVILRSKGNGELTVNGKNPKDHFLRPVLMKRLERPFLVTDSVDKYPIRIAVKGGGISAQADACVHGIARALSKLDPKNQPPLRQAGLLTRDPRAVERKKYGRKKARKRFQFSKR